MKESSSNENSKKYNVVKELKMKSNTTNIIQIFYFSFNLNK